MKNTDGAKIVAISGRPASGKSTLAGLLKRRFRAHVVETRVMQASLGSEWVREGLDRAVSERGVDDPNVFVVDTVMTEAQIQSIRKGYSRVIHVHLEASSKKLQSRRGRRKAGRAAHAEIKNIDSLKSIADCVIDTERCTKQDVLTRAAAHACLYGESGYVDVIVGGQYGSEGKGQVAAHLSKEYDLLVRVGGPNAGHKVPSPEYTYHHLPSGTMSSPAKLLLGPGMVIDMDVLRKEIHECKVTAERLSIDPHAMIIRKSDKTAEKALTQLIGSTGSGVGSATARKIWRKPGVKLAKDVDELKPYVKGARRVIDNVLARGGRIMLEGSQGSLLSIHHGEYPHVTSRETNAAGCLADAGIPPSLVRRVIMVVRTYPIRVGDVCNNTSGRLNKKITFKIISKRSGKPVSEIKKTEIGSTTGRPRKIGEFEWDGIRDAAFLNRPTDIALTFADYVSADNSKAHRFDQLTDDTIAMIEEIECVTGANVSMIATGFNSRSIIDRRTW